jgi:hypothetical protein
MGCSQTKSSAASFCCIKSKSSGKDKQVTIIGENDDDIFDVDHLKLKEKASMKKSNIKEVQVLFYFCDFLSLNDLLRVS